MAQPKVYEFAKEIGVETITLMDKLRKWEIPVKSHMASLSPEDIEIINQRINEGSDEDSEQKPKKKVAKKKTATVAKKKTVAKKASAKKVVKKKVDSSSAANEEEDDKSSGRKIIRRKAGAAMQAEKAIEAAQKQKTIVAKKAAEEVEEEESIEEINEQDSDSNAAPRLTKKIEAVPERAGSKEDQAAKMRENKRKGKILGRVDLTRIQAPQNSNNNSNANTGARPVRTGVAAPPQNVNFPDFSEEGRAGAKAKLPPRLRTVDMTEESRARDKTGAAAKKKTSLKGVDEQTRLLSDQVQFNRTEFRKREIVFQPKKKMNDLGRQALRTQITKSKASKRVVKVHGNMTVANLAQEMKVKSGQLVSFLMKQGITAKQNDELDFETISLIAPEFDYEAQNTYKSVDELIEASGNLEDKNLVSRAPVVTVMGHVDHGKTSLLDSIRNANVASGEAGGITQHIGAYRVQLEGGRPITFLDTPGHAAFTEMRARGARVTDIAVIVVAADDGLMPQTAEAINHAKAAGVPIIVAMNKMDRPNANPDRIKQQLTEFELVPEEWGGSTMFVETVAVTGQGVKELLEGLELTAEMLELKANPSGLASGSVIESKLQKGRGVVATILVQDGTLRVGDYIVAGATYGRVKAMLDDRGNPIKEAGPGIPVEVLGLNETPNAGDMVNACKKERQAEDIAKQRKDEEKAKHTETPNSKMSLEDLFSGVVNNEVKELAIVLKTDVAGSAEAIKNLFEKEKSEKVKIKLIHMAVGGVTESDVLLASTAKALIIGFNVGTEGSATALSKKEGVQIKRYSIIYELADDIRLAMKGMLDPDIVEEAVGVAEVRDMFKTPNAGTIAGCMVLDGKVQSDAFVRIIRSGKQIYQGKVSSLRRFKDSVKEVASGYECGIGIENFNDLKAGDQFEFYKNKEVEAEL